MLIIYILIIMMSRLWCHKWNCRWCTVVVLQLHNSFGFQLSLFTYWEEQSWNLLNAAHILSSLYLLKYLYFRATWILYCCALVRLIVCALNSSTTSNCCLDLLLDVPNSGRGLPRLAYRTKEWDVDFRNYLKKLDSTKPVILCGDLNVAHREIGKL